MKRKKHNPVKRLIRQSKIAVMDLALTMSFADELVELQKYKTGEFVACGHSVAQALNRTAFRWFVVLAVYCIESNGKRKLVTQPLKLEADYKHDALTDFLRDAHQKMQDECRSKCQVINAGWAAAPVPTDDIEPYLVKLLDEERHWNYIPA